MPLCTEAIPCLDCFSNPLVLLHRVKLFTPGNDAKDNDHGKNSCHHQAALYIHVVKKGVDFFHNLNLSFQKWFQTRFSKGGDCMFPQWGPI